MSRPLSSETLKALIIIDSLSREQLIALTAECMATLTNDIVDADAIDRAHIIVRHIANWKQIRDLNPAGFKSAMSELAQLEERYPDLRLEGTEP